LPGAIARVDTGSIVGVLIGGCVALISVVC
jgi:hypothetical protein